MELGFIAVGLIAGLPSGFLLHAYLHHRAVLKMQTVQREHMEKLSSHLGDLLSGKKSEATEQDAVTH